MLAASVVANTSSEAADLAGLFHKYKPYVKAPASKIIMITNALFIRQN
jgi:hypothetical protein